MDEPNSISLMRLLSDESTQSTLSVDSCEYYQTEIFDMLPSMQASRPENNRQVYCKDSEVHHTGAGAEDALSFGTVSRNRTSTQPLKNLAMCLQAKRDARDRRKMQKIQFGFWESWRRSQSIKRKRAWVQMGEALKGLLPWQGALHKIGGRFGVGVKSYFIFLRYLVYLNLLLCALISGFMLGPTIYGRGLSNMFPNFNHSDSVLDLFLGTGYLNRSLVFFSFYTHIPFNHPCLNTSLLYVIGVLTIFFISLLLVVRRMAVGYKHTLNLGKRYKTFVSYKVFCGWDFTIQDPDAASLKHGFLRNDLKLFLDEQTFSLREAQRTLGQWVRLYLLRFILNIVVLLLLSGAFYLIYFATKVSQDESVRSKNDRYRFYSVFLQYLPPITITLVNLFLPQIFRKISAFEDNSFTTQVNATLVRSIFLKLASLGIYLFFLFNNGENKEQCRENYYGREMYKLCIFNFLTTFFNTFFLNYPRKLVQEKFPTSLVARLSGKQQFLIPFNVLDLVYVQTVSWVGVYYCPLLPLIGTVTLTATYYIKKFSLLRCCVAEQRMFRASSSSVMFHFMLLLGLLMSGVTLASNFLKSSSSPSSSCGPFENGDVFNVTGECVKTLPSPAKTALHYLTSEAFALPLLMAQIVILTFYVSRGRANKKTIERLKHMLVMTSSDKRFLVKKHTTMLRPRRANAESVQQERSRTLPLEEDASEGS